MASALSSWSKIRREEQASAVEVTLHRLVRGSILARYLFETQLESLAEKVAGIDGAVSTDSVNVKSEAFQGVLPALKRMWDDWRPVENACLKTLEVMFNFVNEHMEGSSLVAAVRAQKEMLDAASETSLAAVEQFVSAAIAVSAWAGGVAGCPHA